MEDCVGEGGVTGCEVCLLLKFVLHCSGVLQQLPGQCKQGVIISLVAFSGMSIMDLSRLFSM